MIARARLPAVSPTTSSMRHRFMADSFLLIPGRTSVQGTTLNEGKYTDGYQVETNTLQMCLTDMKRMGLVDADRVRIWNNFGEVTVPIRAAKGDELPAGLLFISYGDASCRLMGGNSRQRHARQQVSRRLGRSGAKSVSRSRSGQLGF